MIEPVWKNYLSENDIALHEKYVIELLDMDEVFEISVNDVVTMVRRFKTTFGDEPKDWRKEDV